jgi:hypothetical protein
MGFSAVSEYAAADEAGQVWVTQFRKLISGSGINTNAWIDYTYFSGSPPANFYASSPLTAALVDASRGIYVPSVTPATQHVSKLTLMAMHATDTSTVAGQQRLILCDYLIYYPFIDTDATGEEQTLDNTITIPRYAGGQVVAVSQSATSAAGQFTFTYTNQDGVSGRVSPVNYAAIVNGGGLVTGASGVGASYNPFLHLQAGDSGVRSIESVTMSVAGGGLMCLVIVKPLLFHKVSQECRRTTTGNLESYGACDEITSIIHKAGAPEIKDGAVLGLFSAGAAGSMASVTLIGTLETVWN